MKNPSYTETTYASSNDIHLLDPELAKDTRQLFQQGHGYRTFSQEESYHAGVPSTENKLEEQDFRTIAVGSQAERYEALLQERNDTIASLAGNVYRLEQEKEYLNTIIDGLRIQFTELKRQDWQVYSGVGKKRKFTHEPHEVLPSAL